MNGQAGPSRQLRKPKLGLARAQVLKPEDYRWLPRTRRVGRKLTLFRASQFVTDKVPAICSELCQNRTFVVTLLPLCGSALAIAQRGAKRGGKMRGLLSEVLLFSSVGAFIMGLVIAAAILLQPAP
jgi:hypothetical protein